MKNIVTLLLWLVLGAANASETLEVEYASFYSHVKKLDNPETDALRFAFGFWHINQQRLCHITKAEIVTQKQILPLEVERHSRFTVPTDKILKMAKATVNIQLADQANQCDMSVQLETLPEYLKTEYSNHDLSLLLTQYQAFFSDMGGFLSFLMPSVEGIKVLLKEDQDLSDASKAMLDNDGSLLLTKEWIALGNNLTLAKKPLRITAIVNK